MKLWLDDRLGVSVLAAAVQKKEVPVHRATVWYYLGGMTLFLFVIQALTGALLLLYYRPGAESAFESVQFIMTEVEFGWLIRSIHSWSANLMVATLFIHMFSVYFAKAYHPPREMTWLTGVLLLFITLGFGFSGYLLPWNKLAFFATKVGTDIAGVVPVVGHFLLRFLRGGDDVTGATLTRFFGFHVAILPALATVVIVVHLLLVQRLGMSVPPRYQGQPLRSMKFFPNFLFRDLVGWVLAIGALAALAAVFPWELGEKADPFASAPAGIRPEWYFLFMFQTLKYVPSNVVGLDGEVVAILAFGVGGLLWVAVPFLDRPSASRKTSLFFTWFGLALVAYILVMTAVAYLS